MSNWEVILIIALVIGVIASNLAVLKYSAKFKLPQFGHTKHKSIKDNAKTKVVKNNTAVKNHK